MNGWIILDKPVGLGSTQAVGAVKRVCREAGLGKVKVGHGGTLDPLASGVLPIALGEATKLTGHMLDADKIYRFTIAFGVQTSGLDLEGEVVATSEVRPTSRDVMAVLPQFLGPIEQIPPAFSAIKIGGERAYDLARKGQQVEMQARKVTVHDLTLNDMAMDDLAMGDADLDAPLQSATFTAHVSKGTYIRSLARDLALAVGTVGHVTMLRRVKAGPFRLEQAISLDNLNAFGQGAAQSDIILPLEVGLVDIPALDLSLEAAEAIRQGRIWTREGTQDGLYWGRGSDMRPIALIQVSAEMLKVVRGFNL
ncbi:MAG TPA: tRNA pseudouridine(55) synthase TruB [Sphingopyxis sp.]|nr:tRNA pseudouridine(55) synthase TruB [Sphingopyxis sp.]